MAIVASSSRDDLGSRFMIIKRGRLSFSRYFVLFASSRAAADSFLKTNFDFPIRGRDLRPPVSPGRLFCALSRLPLSGRCLFFGPREGGARFFTAPSYVPQGGRPDSVPLLREMDSRTYASTTLVRSRTHVFARSLARTHTRSLSLTDRSLVTGS